MEKLKRLWRGSTDLAGFLVLTCAIITGIVVSTLTLPFNIDTLNDEGFHFLTLQRALSGHIDGSSQWASIVAAVLGEKICRSVLSLRIVSFCLTIATALIFFALTHRIAATHDKARYLIVILFFSLPTLGGIMICYNEVSQLLLVVSCATLYRACYDTSRATPAIWAGTTGLLAGLSLFSILPSTLIIIASAVLLITIRYWKRWPWLFLYLASLAFGICLALLVFHFFVADLNAVFAQMKSTAQTITTLERSYDPLSFIVGIVLFLRDFAFCALMITGISLLTAKLAKWSKPTALIIYIVGVVLYSVYQKKPCVTTAMLAALLWLQPLIEQANAQQGIKAKDLFTFRNIMTLFLIVFPLLASIGTNVYIGKKMSFFLIPWALILWHIDFRKNDPLLRNGGMIAIALILSLSFCHPARSIIHSQHRIETGGLAGMYMNPVQYEHLGTVDSIALQYGFKRDSSVVFCTQLSMTTLIYMGGVPCGLYFQPMDFAAKAGDDTPTPDFLFLTQYDKQVAGEKIKEMGWGWPDEFDEHYVGSPDPLDVGYSTERWLYCRRQTERPECE